MENKQLSIIDTKNIIFRVWIGKTIVFSLISFLLLGFGFSFSETLTSNYLISDVSEIAQSANLPPAKAVASNVVLDNPVLRSDLAVLVAHSLALPLDLPRENPFLDLSSQDWFYAQVLAFADFSAPFYPLAETFAPFETITRGEAAQVLAGAFKLKAPEQPVQRFLDVPATSKYFTPVSALSNAKVLAVSKNFRPQDPIHFDSLSDWLKSLQALKKAAEFN